jgi:hypothetical protein
MAINTWSVEDVVTLMYEREKVEKNMTTKRRSATSADKGHTTPRPWNQAAYFVVLVFMFRDEFRFVDIAGRMI